jgi:hypothetical protein
LTGHLLFDAQLDHVGEPGPVPWEPGPVPVPVPVLADAVPERLRYPNPITPPAPGAKPDHKEEPCDT